jgi:hypothetical protein
MIKNISQYFNVFKKPKTLKMRAKNAYSAFKRKTIDTSKKIKKKYDSLHPYKKAAIVGTGVAGIGYLGYKNIKSTSKDMEKKLIKEFKKLPKSDPRFNL